MTNGWFLPAAKMPSRFPHKTNTPSAPGTRNVRPAEARSPSGNTGMQFDRCERDVAVAQTIHARAEWLKALRLWRRFSAGPPGCWSPKGPNDSFHCLEFNLNGRRLVIPLTGSCQAVLLGSAVSSELFRLAVRFRSRFRSFRKAQKGQVGGRSEPSATR